MFFPFEPNPKIGHWNQQVNHVVGPGRFELSTCRLGGDRSIHLSYGPTPPLVYQRSMYNGSAGGFPRHQ